MTKKTLAYLEYQCYIVFATHKGLAEWQPTGAVVKRETNQTCYLVSLSFDNGPDLFKTS